MRAAPQLTACHAKILAVVDTADARRMLRNEAPFQPLRLHNLGVEFGDNADEAASLALAADLATHASLKMVDLNHAVLSTLHALDAVVDVALARQLVSVCFWGCRLSPASAPALVRLPGSPTLTDLTIGQDEQLLDGPSAALLGDALRANRTLASLSLQASSWHDTDAVASLLSALTGHSSLRKLELPENDVPLASMVIGAALGALVAANAPALTELDVSSNLLSDAVLRPLFEALPANTHLRELKVDGNGMSPAFARNVLLPAVHANTSLWLLIAYNLDDGQENAYSLDAALLAYERGLAAGAV
jgi:hypothetical protein